MKKGLVRVFVPIATAVLLAAGTVAVSLDDGGPKTPDCEDSRGYCPSVEQQRVDQSFSPFAINKQVATFVDSNMIIEPAVAAEGGLTELRNGSCENWGECYLQDSHRVQHGLSGTPDNLYVVTKAVQARDFIGRSLPALGIGTARTRDEVIANVRRFISPIALDCDNPPSIVDCHAYLDPGWIEITFDDDDQLNEVNFAGYHFI